MKRGGKLKWLLLKSLLLCYSNTILSQQNSSQLNQEQLTPEQQNSTQNSAEFLEFLADWGEVDEETFSIIEQHGLLDTSEEQTEEN